ncbi:Arm DNA-binding domain-containing protein [Symbiopectobacterium sp. Eva_TO]
MKKQYPTGVECHGGMLRIWFMHEGRRCRESIGVPDTPKNRKIAGELRQSVVYAIKTGTFNYDDKFPKSSSNKTENSSLTVMQLFNKWLNIKRYEISENTMIRYRNKVRSIVITLGVNVPVSGIRKQDLAKMRNELIEGFHLSGNGKKGRSVVTVNSYMSTALSVFAFGKENGYMDADLKYSVKMLRKAKVRPDPLSEDEFDRLITALPSDQTRNLWTLAFFTGMRHGELCSLAWEDIDMKDGTLCVRRNITTAKIFSVPKTDAGTDRIIKLNDRALQALKNQMAITRMGAKHIVTVHTRQHGKTRHDECTFVFSPSVSCRNGAGGICYSSESIRQTWTSASRKAGIRHRKAYQSRHTFACWMLSAGANPYFIASQMGHSSPQMLYQVYGDWMPGNNDDQIALINSKIAQNAPHMPHSKII